MVRAFAASNDAQKLKQFIHRGLVKPSDISQIAESRTRAQQNIPLFDRVLLKCEEEIKNSVLLDRNTNESKQIVNEDLSFMDNSHLVVIHKEKGENIALQHGVNSRDLNLIIGSPQTILKNSSTFNENQQEVSSEDSNEEQENSSQKFDNNGIVPDMITRNIMKKIIGLSTANRRELNSYILHKVIECFRRHETDYGSPQVSGILMNFSNIYFFLAAVLTFKIRNLACHVYTFPQDTQSRKSLDEMTHKRRKIFEYMKRVDFGNYMKLVSDLGLKVA